MAEDVVVVGARRLLEGDGNLLLLEACLEGGAEALAEELGAAESRHADVALVHALRDFGAPDDLKAAEDPAHVAYQTEIRNKHEMGTNWLRTRSLVA